MYLIDTNICIYAMKNTYPNLSRKLFQISPDEILVSSITVGELEYGCAKSNWGERSRSVMNLFLSTYRILPFDEEDAKMFGRLRAEMEKKGAPIGTYDILLAGQALSKGLTFVTHNTREFNRVPTLQIEDWVI